MILAALVAALTLQPSAALVAAGDIAACGSRGDAATAAVVSSLGGTVATLGDNAYPSGSAADFARCYAPSWGRFRDRTRPAAGNHDYFTPGAAGYFAYFGRRAGPRDRGWYAYTLGTWRVIVLNSNCDAVGGCGRGSAQERWLRQELARHPTRCTLAYWHHPRFSSGTFHGSDVRSEAFWRALYAAGAEVVLNGHEHNYERFAPQTPGGRLDPERGIREFVVGTGGRSHYGFGPPLQTSRVRNPTAYGVLELTLGTGVYGWRFHAAGGARFSDSGTGRCRY